MDFEQAREEVSQRAHTIVNLVGALQSAFMDNPDGEKFRRIKQQLEELGATVQIVDGRIRVEA